MRKSILAHKPNKKIFFTVTSDTHNKLQHGNNYNPWNILDLVLDLNYICFSNPNPNPNMIHLPEH